MEGTRRQPIFEVEEFMITQQKEANKPSYKVTLTIKGENPVVTGDIIARATTGDRWFVTESYKNKVFVIPYGSYLPMDMIGTWGCREHMYLEGEQ